MRLAARNLTLSVAQRVLVRDLTVSMQPGETWAVLGANGSGKTSLLHVLAGIAAPAAGEVLLEERPIASYAPRQRARRIAVLFQDHGETFPSTVIETVLTARHPHLDRFAFPDADDLARARAALADVDLAGFESRWMGTLSGGERRRAEIAATLAQDAPILLLDEPTNHLDLRHQTQLLRRVLDAARLRVLVLHDVNLARRFCTHGILLFGDGRCLHGPLAQLLTRSNLERLYDCRLREVIDADAVYFLPDN